ADRAGSNDRTRHAHQRVDRTGASRHHAPPLGGRHATLVTGERGAALSGAGHVPGGGRAMVRGCRARESRLLAHLLHPRAPHALRHLRGLATGTVVLLPGYLSRRLPPVERSPVAKRGAACATAPEPLARAPG